MRCRVLAPLATADRAPKASSKKTSGNGASGRGPVELSLRQSRLEQPDGEEAVKRRGVPDVGSTAKVNKYKKNTCLGCLCCRVTYLEVAPC